MKLPASKERAHNRLAGRGQVRRVPLSFGVAPGGLCAFAIILRVTLAAALLTTQILPAAVTHVSPSATELLIQKARSLEARDRQDLAAQVWHQVLVTNPNQPDALAALARWAKRSGRSEEANEYLARLRRVSPDASALTELDVQETGNKGTSRLDEAVRLAANHRFDEAMRIYREVFGSNPPAGGWSIAYYQTFANTPGGFDPAVAALKQLAQTYPDVTDYKLAAGTLMSYRTATREAGIGLLSSIEGSTAAATKAKSAWREALLWEKSNPAYAHAFSLYLARYKDAELQSALAAMPAQAAALSAGSRQEQLGYEALKLGKTSDAERDFDRALNQDNGSWRAHAGLGFVRMKAGDFDGAVQELEAAHNSAPADAAVRNSLANARFWQAMHQGAQAVDRQNWPEAISHYQTALSLRKEDHDAARAVGGAFLASGFPAKAISYLTLATKSQPGDQASWCALAQAKLEAQGGRAALAVMKEAPLTLLPALEQNIEWRALQASAYVDAGEQAQALKIYRDINALDSQALSPSQNLQMAGLALHLQQNAAAVSYAEKALEAQPNQTGSWELLLSALVASGKASEAARRYELMPAECQQAALKHPGFQETLASLKESSGDLDGARTLLEQVVNTPGPSDSREKIGVKIHLAQLLAKLGQGVEAESIVNTLTDSHPDDVNAWRAELLVLQTLHRSNDIVLSSARMPEAVSVRLGREGDMVNILAAAHVANGDKTFGIKILENYISRAEDSDRTDTAAQRIQLAWLLLDSPKDSGNLYNLLDQLNGRADLTPVQRKELSDLWVTWILRTADTAHKTGNDTRALAVLQEGIKMFPDNGDLRGALAGDLLAIGNTKRALNVYSNWGLAGAKSSDYAGAIGAALAEHNFSYADAWIAHALAQWPADPKLLTLAGERAQTRGDMKQAELLWKEALAQQKAQPSEMPVADNPEQPSLRTLLAGSTTPQPSGNADFTKVHLSSFQPGPAPVADTSALLSATGSSPMAKALLPEASPTDSLQDKITGLESRNTPYVGSNMSVWERGGQSGFSRLVIQQAQFEASTVLGDQLRASLLLLPTYVSSGTPDGSGNALFGSQTTPGVFGTQNASGLAAEAQLSSNSFGLRLGTSPQGFLLHNWIGGVRVQPKHGPITFLLERDSVKDSMLSYAGARDPVSNQIWGGVMANTASVQGRWGDDRSGIYVNGAYQTVEGREVARNTGLNGNAGTWWKVASLPTGSLTVGMNFSAMHYDRNLRYFTLGQGGYFSPQQYVLFSVPFRWTGRYGRNLQYTIGGSLGAQHFTEDASDYYPLNAALQAASNARYPAFASTGANFSFDGRVSYQMAPHWFLGVFANANNARDYTAAAAGLFVKYTFEERPMSLDTAAPSIPDWRGQQPFLLF